MNFFLRKAIEFKNSQSQAASALLGIVQGLLADGELNDAEIRFLRDWLSGNEHLGVAWPGSVLLLKVQEVLADGVVRPEERMHLVEVLRQLVGGSLEDLAQQQHVCELALDQPLAIEIAQRSFCFTGEFAFGMRSQCEEVTLSLGGEVRPSVTRKLDYLVVGGLGSAEWKHGSYGTKVVKAMAAKEAGAALQLVHEDLWAAAVMEAKQCG